MKLADKLIDIVGKLETVQENRRINGRTAGQGFGILRNAAIDIFNHIKGYVNWSL